MIVMVRMTVALSYTVNIPSALSTALTRAKELRGFKDGMVQAGGYLVGLQGWYPPESHRPMEFKSEKQRRYVIWAIRNGIIKVPYVRTGLTQRSMGMSIEDNGMTIRTGTNLDRAQWTHGENQARYHTITGWRKTLDIAQREAGNAYMLIYNASRTDFE